MHRLALLATFVAVLFTAIAPAAAQDQPLIIDVWPGKVPGDTAKIGDEKVLDQKPGEKPVKRITNVSKPTLTIFRPAKDRDTGAAVLICPGGGYNILAWDLEGEEVACVVACPPSPLDRDVGIH